MLRGAPQTMVTCCMCVVTLCRRVKILLKQTHLIKVGYSCFCLSFSLVHVVEKTGALKMSTTAMDCFSSRHLLSSMLVNSMPIQFPSQSTSDLLCVLHIDDMLLGQGKTACKCICFGWLL